MSALTNNLAELEDMAIDLKELLKKFEDSIVWCSNCRSWVISCPKCGMTACTGGYGEVDGKKCDLCPAAYAMMAQIG